MGSVICAESSPSAKCSSNDLFQVTITLITPGSSPAVSHNEDTLAIIVAHQQHGMAAMLSGSGVVGVRCVTIAVLRTKEALGQFQAEDHGMTFSQTAAHAVQVNRNSAGL